MEKSKNKLKASRIINIKDFIMKKNKGFTIIEVMVSSTILLIVLSAMYLLIIRTQTFHLISQRGILLVNSARWLPLGRFPFKQGYPSSASGDGSCAKLD